jgi:hypothetical protein
MSNTVIDSSAKKDPCNILIKLVISLFSLHISIMPMSTKTRTVFLFLCLTALHPLGLGFCDQNNPTSLPNKLLPISKQRGTTKENAEIIHSWAPNETGNKNEPGKK